MGAANAEQIDQIEVDLVVDGEIKGHFIHRVLGTPGWETV